MLCRSVDDMDLLLKRCADTYRDSRGLIIPLCDEDIRGLLDLKAEGDDVAIDDFFQERYHKIAMA